VARFWGAGARVERTPSSVVHPHEAGLLRLDSTIARNALRWQPRWALDHALKQTVSWYQAWLRGCDMATVSRDQIRAYQALCGA